MSPALAGEFFTTWTPGKPQFNIHKSINVTHQNNKMKDKTGGWNLGKGIGAQMLGVKKKQEQKTKEKL